MDTTTVTGRGRLTAVRAKWLFDGTSSTPAPRPVVLIDGTTIVAVDHEDAMPTAAFGDGVDVVDFPDATILPGLVDTHVHLSFDTSADPVATLAARTAEEASGAMAEAGRAALRGGVTTLRDLGDRDFLSLALRGRADQPTIVAAGPPLTGPGGHCHFLGGVIEATPEGARRAVRAHVERGVDVIKVMASGGTMTPGTLQHEAQFAPAVLAAIVDEAHRHGRPVTAHAHAVAAVADCVAAGMDGMEHVSFWTEDSVDTPTELMQAIADRRIVVGATLGTAPVDGSQPPPAVLARMDKFMANFRLMYELGIPMVAGSDAGIGPVKPHDVLRYAPASLQDVLGMSPADALRTVTSVAADVCGLGHRKGRVAPGFDADLLVVDGDPLAELAALHRIRAVYARGARVEL